MVSYRTITGQEEDRTYTTEWSLSHLIMRIDGRTLGGMNPRDEPSKGNPYFSKDYKMILLQGPKYYWKGQN